MNRLVIKKKKDSKIEREKRKWKVREREKLTQKY